MDIWIYGYMDMDIWIWIYGYGYMDIFNYVELFKIIKNNK